MSRHLPMVDTSASAIIASNGESFPYRLERKRRWNVGMRRHVNELTGRIDLTCRNAYVICDSMAQALDWAEIYARHV